VSKKTRDSVNNGQPKAGPALGLLDGLVEAPKLLENLLPVTLRNAGSRVPDFDPQTVATPPAAE
jgi:hypothetical protein